MAGFLGINITRDKENKSLTMTQIGLIKIILTAIDIENCNLKYTLADKEPLYKNEGEDPYCEDWEYRSIVGMMLYLADSTRPDIAYTVHQCAIFSHSPKRSYEIGVKHIDRYLKGTQTKGIIMTPDTENMGTDMYADADFSGLYSTEDKMDPVSVKIRSSVLLTFGNVLILWSSKIQSETFLSTMET